MTVDLLAVILVPIVPGLGFRILRELNEAKKAQECLAQECLAQECLAQECLAQECLARAARHQCRQIRAP